MSKFANLSVEAKNIVINFSNAQLRKSFLNAPTLTLGASLYALKTNAQVSILEALKDIIVPLNEMLSQEKIEVLNQEYANVILACFDQDSELIHNLYGQQTTPSAIVDLCHKLAECKPGSNVYLPYCGMGEFARKLQDCNCEGQEQNLLNWGISQVVVDALGIQANIACEVLGTVKPSKAYDYIFTCPPFGRTREVVDHLIHMFRYNIADMGELYAVIPMSVCFSTIGSEGFDLRKTAKDLKASIAVIALPQVFQPYTRENTCLFYLKKDGEAKIVLTDASASTFLADQQQKGKVPLLKVDSILETIFSQDESLVWIGTYMDLTKDLSLLPTRYLPIQDRPRLKRGERFIRLGDLIQRVPMKKLNSKTHRPLIGMRELYSSYMNCDLSVRGSVDSLIETTIVISEPCLLAGFIGGKFKVARLTDATESTFVSLRNEVYPIVCCSNEITEDFLLRSLLCEFTEKQAVRFSTGTTISRLSFGDMCEIQVIVPSLEVQEQICKEDTRRGLTEADRKLLETHEEFRIDMHMKKHAIGQTLANFKNWWKLLQQARESSNGILDDNFEIGRLRKVKVADIYENIQTAMTKLSTQLNKFDSGYGLVKENFALTEFIEKYINENKNPLFQFQYDAYRHRADADLNDVVYDEEADTYSFTDDYSLRKGDPLDYVNFPQEALVMVFNNIISNACDHGFANRENEDNIIRIELISEGTNYVVTISNNGHPLKPDVTKEDVFIYGQTSGDTNCHFGIGGYEVKKLMESFDGSVEFIVDPDNDFSISYRLIFQDTNILGVLG